MPNSPISANKLYHSLQTLVCKGREILDNVSAAFKSRGNNLKKNFLVLFIFKFLSMTENEYAQLYKNIT